MILLIFYGFIVPTSFPGRQSFLKWMQSAITWSCIALERDNSACTSLGVLLVPHECVLYVANSDRCPQAIYGLTMWSLINCMTCSPTKSFMQDAKFMLGFMMQIGAQRFGGELDAAERRCRDLRSSQSYNEAKLRCMVKMCDWIVMARSSTHGTAQWRRAGCRLVQTCVDAGEGSYFRKLLWIVQLCMKTIS